MSPSRAGFARQRESLEDKLAVKNAGGIMIGNEPFYPGQEEPLTEDQMARIEYGPGDIESFPPEVQEKYKQQMQDQGSSLATATPAATTTPELVEGNATPTATPQALQEAADRAGENGPQRQQLQARIDARNNSTSTVTTPELVEGTDTPTARTPNESDVAVSKIIAAQIGPVAAANYLENIGLGREQTLPIREIVEGTATPAAATTPGPVEGTATPAATTTPELIEGISIGHTLSFVML
jgi:hypothetical protein